MSNNFNGYTDGGANWTSIEFNSPYDLTPTGVYGKAIVPAGYGVIAINTSGVGQTVVVLPVGYEKAVRSFTVSDFGGTANGCNLSISGLNGETFRYMPYSPLSGIQPKGIPSGNVLMTNNYETRTFQNFNGTPTGWLVY